MRLKLLCLAFAIGCGSDTEKSAAEEADADADADSDTDTDADADADTDTDTDADADTDADTDADADADAFTEADMVGIWIGDCAESPMGDGSYNQLTFEMSETTWALDYVSHGNSTCSAPFLAFNIGGDFVLEGPSSVVEGARDGIFSFASRTVTPFAPEAAEMINGACSTDEATPGEAYDLQDGCLALGSYPIADCPADYDIVMVTDEGRRMLFGARPEDNNMCSPDKRPTTFEGGAEVELQEYNFTSEDMVGTWVSECFLNPSDGVYYQLSFELTQNTWDLDYVAHASSDCDSPYITVEIAGEYVLEGASTSEAGARNAVFGFSTRTVTPNEADAVEVVNTACSTSEAAEGVALDISGGCEGLGAYPISECPADYDIVKLSDDGTQLSFGARPEDNNMCTPEARPDTFVNGAVVTRQ